MKPIFVFALGVIAVVVGHILAAPPTTEEQAREAIRDAVRHLLEVHRKCAEANLATREPMQRMSRFGASVVVPKESQQDFLLSWQTAAKIAAQININADCMLDGTKSASWLIDVSQSYFQTGNFDKCLSPLAFASNYMSSAWRAAWANKILAGELSSVIDNMEKLIVRQN